MTTLPSVISVAGVSVPRLAFGVGSLMKWAPGHTHPLPTDSSVETLAALRAGFRHINTGDLYTNKDSVAKAIQDAAIPRQDLFISLKINTWNVIRPAGREDMLQSVADELERYKLGGFADLVQLHFPPRGVKGNLTSREAWRILEELKDRGLAKLIGVSNWTLADYDELFSAQDLKHKPQINEYEFNPHLLFDPSYQALRSFEAQHGIIAMHYGLLTSVGPRMQLGSDSHLKLALSEITRQTGLNEGEVILKWAYDTLSGIVVTSTSKAERAQRTVQLLTTPTQELTKEHYRKLEAAAQKEGYEDKVFYKHGHMKE